MAATRDYERLVRTYIKPKMKDNIWNSTPWLEYMRKRSTSRGSWGRRIDLPLEIDKGHGGKYSDLDVIARTRKEIAQYAYYNLTYYYTELTVSHQDRLTCRGNEDVVRLLQAKAKNSVKTMSYNLTNGMKSGTAADDIVGVDTHINVTAAQTLGGLSTTDVTAWDNKRDVTGGAVTLEKIIDMAALVTNGNDKPEVIFTDKFIEAYIWANLLQAQERYTKGYFNMASELKSVAGLPMLTDWVFEDGSDGTGGKMYFHNNDHMRLYVHSADDMKYWPYQKPVDQFSFTAYWTIALQMCSDSRRRQGLISGITT